jgi:hypothetical protein
VAFEEIPVRRHANGKREFFGMSTFLETAQRELGFDLDPRLTSVDMQNRFYKASVRQYGRLMHLLKNASELAVLEDKDGQIFDHLGTAFEKLYKVLSFGILRFRT